MPAAALLAELTERGIELHADGERLRFRPRSAMTPALAERVRACKGELLAVLQADDVLSLPGRPRPRAGYIVELIRRDGRWRWRQRREDAADRAMAAWYANASPGQQSKEPI